MGEWENKKGFTLLEVLVAVGISTMITYAIFMAMRSGDAQVQTTDIKMTVQDSAREGLYKMLQEIRHSSSNPANGNIVIAPNSIIFNIPNPANPVASDFTENWGNTHRIQYSIVGGQLRRTNQTTGAMTVVANDITSITFAQAGEVITATINAQRQLIDGRLVPATPLQLTAQAELRNS